MKILKTLCVKFKCVCADSVFSHPELTRSGRRHSNARKGIEVVYEEPSADLSLKVDELKMEACGAYGVLYKV